MRPNNAQLQSPLLTTFLTVMALAAPKAAAYSNNTKTLGGPRVKWLVQHWPFVRRAQNGPKCSKTESQGLSLYLGCITPPLVLLLRVRTLRGEGVDGEEPQISSAAGEPFKF